MTGRGCYVLLRRRYEVSIRRPGDAPLRRLGNVSLRRRWMFHLRRTCDVLMPGGKFSEFSKFPSFDCEARY